VLEHAVDLRRSRPGDVIHVPYEVTIGQGCVSVSIYTAVFSIPIAVFYSSGVEATFEKG